MSKTRLDPPAPLVLSVIRPVWPECDFRNMAPIGSSLRHCSAAALCSLVRIFHHSHLITHQLFRASRAAITHSSQARCRARRAQRRARGGQWQYLRRSERSSLSFGVMELAPVCLTGASGTPWKSRIVRDRAALARLLPPESRQGDDPRSPPRRGSSHSRVFPARSHQWLYSIRVASAVPSAKSATIRHDYLTAQNICDY